MIDKFLILTAFACCFLFEAQALGISKEQGFFYSSSNSRTKLQYYFAVIDLKNMKLVPVKSSRVSSSASVRDYQRFLATGADYLALNRQRVSSRKKPVYAVMSKSNYVINSSVNGFKRFKERYITNFQRQNRIKVKPHYNVFSDNRCFQKPERGSKPYYTQCHSNIEKDKLHRHKFIERLVELEKSKLGTPEHIEHIATYNYGPVKIGPFSSSNTVKFGYSYSLLYPRNDGKTLIVNYFLSYYYQLPPGLVGGVNRIHEGFVEKLSEKQKRFN